MAEQKKTTPVKPKKTTAVSESGERRVVLSAKTDPLAFLQEEKQKLAEEIEKAQETDEALKAQLTKKEEPVSSEFTVTKSRKAANREAEQAWEDAKKQMAQWSENSSFDWLRDDPNDDADDEEEGIPISRARRQPISPAQRRNRGYDRTKQILAVCLIFVAMAVSVGGFLFDKLDLVQFDDGVKTEVQPTEHESPRRGGGHYGRGTQGPRIHERLSDAPEGRSVPGPRCRQHPAPRYRRADHPLQHECPVRLHDPPVHPHAEPYGEARQF